VEPRAAKFFSVGLGKASTVVQIAFVLAVVAGLGNSFVLVLKGLTVALTAWSGIDYAKRAATADRLLKPAT